jgi:hypothetical protein
LLLSSSSDLPVSGKSPIEARRESGEYILVFAHDDDVVYSCRNATHGSSRTSKCRTDSGRAALRRCRRVDDLDAIVAKIALESMVNCIPFNRIWTHHGVKNTRLVEEKVDYVARPKNNDCLQRTFDCTQVHPPTLRWRSTSIKNDCTCRLLTLALSLRHSSPPTFDLAGIGCWVSHDKSFGWCEWCDDTSLNSAKLR